MMVLVSAISISRVATARSPTIHHRLRGTL